MVKRLFLTPPVLPETTSTRCIEVPDSKEWWGIFNAALLLTAQAFNYEQVNETDLTAQEVADLCFQIYVQYLAGECHDVSCYCNLRVNPATGRLQGSYDGETWEDVPYGPYDEPVTPVLTEWPEPEPRAGTSDDIRCIAARNAVLVVRQMYDQTVAVAAAGAVSLALSLVQQVISAWVTMLTGGGFAINVALEIAFDMIDAGIDDAFVWGDEQSDELQCIFYCNSTEADGVVSFDITAIGDEMIADWFAGGFSLAKILAVSFLGAEGLKTAGGIQNYDAADCSECDCFPTWCYEFDFLTDDGGFTTARVKNTGGTNFCSSDTNNPTWVSGQGWKLRKDWKQAVKAFTRSFITEMDITFTIPAGQTGGPIFAIDLFDDDGSHPYDRSYGTFFYQNNTVGTNVITGLAVNEYANQLALERCSPNDNFTTVSKLVLRGTGDNPFGEDNC